MRTIVVVPAYNEETNIERVVAGLYGHGYEVVVVDDGSTDSTAALAKKAGAAVIQHAINLGQGAALQTGMTYAIRKNADVIVTFDADGQHQIQDIKKMIEALENVDIVLGSRFLKNTHNAPFAREVVLRGGVILQNLFYGLKLTDAHNGLRVMTRKAAEKIRIRSRGMAHSSEFIEQIAHHRLKYKEAPVNILYTEYSLARGQKNSAALGILFKMILAKFMR